MEAGTLARIDDVLQRFEDRSHMLREAIEREIKRRELQRRKTDRRASMNEKPGAGVG